MTDVSGLTLHQKSVIIIVEILIQDRIILYFNIKTLLPPICALKIVGGIRGRPCGRVIEIKEKLVSVCIFTSLPPYH